MRAIALFLIILFSLQLKGQGNFQLNRVTLLDDYEYAIPTMAFSATNSIFTTFNIIRIGKKDLRKSNAPFGLILGTAQTAYGILNEYSVENNARAFTTANIGIGLITVASSALRLIIKEPVQESKTAFNVYYLPSVDQRTAMVGFRFTKTL